MKFSDERARLEHLAYMGRCWRDCVSLAENSIAHSSDDPADENVRRTHVFDLAQQFFDKHALDVVGFIRMSEFESQGKRERRRNPPLPRRVMAP